ncbi:MAG: radical SAM protein [Chloroflexi bacterium]|nr:radical SAM protein [Chloroflexota bacterium]
MAHVEYYQAKSILSKASGFINSYDYTLNPYGGCAFACAYCYAAFFAPNTALQDTWGQWVQVKENALDLLRKRRKRPLIDKTIYMSSVTDPYQPVEKRLEITRALLYELLDYHQVRLVVQTRSPLVTRDIDLLRQFPRARVHMTVTTDDDEVRKAFEPLCPSNTQRLWAARTLADADIPTSITLTPLLPVRDAAGFARALRDTRAQKFVVQDFHPTTRRFAAGTGQQALTAAERWNWDSARYEAVKALLRAALPNFYEGKEGFAPAW